MSLKDLEKPLGIALVVSVLGLSFMVLKPFIIAILWGGLIAFATWPLHRWLGARLHSMVASAILLGLILCSLVVIPMVGLGLSLADDGKDLIQPLVAMTKTTLPDLPGWVSRIPLIGDPVEFYWGSWQAKKDAWFPDVIPFAQGAAKRMVAQTGVIGSVFAQIAMAILFTFWFYLQGQQIAGALQQILDRILGASHNRYWQLAADTIQNVINGILGTAVAQGVVAGIGFMIAGIPGALMLGLLTCVLSIIPMMPPLVWIPATIWLFMQGDVGYGIFMGLWGLLAISGVDNLVRPFLISRGSVMPVTIILLGVIGGMLAFGFLGLFVGPVMLALSYTLIREWMAQQATP